MALFCLFITVIIYDVIVVIAILINVVSITNINKYRNKNINKIFEKVTKGTNN